MMAFLMLPEGVETFLAARMALRSRGLPSGSPPLRAAMEISLIRRVNAFPRLASVAAFLCLMEVHLAWPDMITLSGRPSLLDRECIYAISTLLRIAKAVGAVKAQAVTS